jgi:hypothetical protein
MTGMAEAPFDIISDYFRSTAGVFEDQIECPEEITAASEVFANLQMASLQYFRVVPIPVKRVFFPLHKGMDGFMNPRQYAELYWKPMDKIFAALSGGMPFHLLDWAKEQVTDRMKYLIDNCASGGGYILDTSGSMEGVKYENLVAMFETARTYGTK